MLFLIYYKLFVIVILKMFCLQNIYNKPIYKGSKTTKGTLNLFFLSLVKDFIKYLLNNKKDF